MEMNSDGNQEKRLTGRDKWFAPWKSTIINLTALIVLFTAIFLFHRVGVMIISDQTGAKGPAAKKTADADKHPAPQQTDLMAVEAKSEAVPKAEGDSAEKTAAAKMSKKRPYRGRPNSNPKKETSVEELDNEAARQSYLMANRTSVKSPFKAPAKNRDFIPFEKRK